MDSSANTKREIRFASAVGWPTREIELRKTFLDEFEVSPVDVVRAFLQGYTVFVGRDWRPGAQWERLFATEQLVERAFQSRLDSQVVGELIVSRGLNIAVAFPRIRYSTKALESYPRVSNEEPTYISIESEPASPAAFVPSKSLTDIWIKSLSTLAREAGKTGMLDITQDDVRQKFTQALTSSLGTLAQQLRYEHAIGQITHHGEFTSRIQVEICDAFLILPSMSTEFLALLKKELIDAIRNGWDYRGAWGRLELTNTGELAFELALPEFVSSPEFVRARRVE